ncbi:hypothetical protein [Candidatus Poriferisocius sp.]|uniref:hypothetical protein n=1 Tax=Candidatus Poriferisocius sp. TaxID=3101276 RepID=UPI003B5C3C9A
MVAISATPSEWHEAAASPEPGRFVYRCACGLVTVDPDLAARHTRRVPNPDAGELWHRRDRGRAGWVEMACKARVQMERAS